MSPLQHVMAIMGNKNPVAVGMQFQTEAVSEVTDGTILLYHSTNAEKPDF